MEAEDRERNSISLIVKSPNQALDQHRLDQVNLNWTVRDLKIRLSRDFPTKPDVKEQRLIYRGRLLPDHLLLRDTITQGDFVPTIHLVCPFRNVTCEPQGTRTESEDPQRNTSGSAEAELRLRRNATSSSSSPSSSPSSSHWGSAANEAERSTGPQLAPPSFPIYSLYSAEQQWWLQHVYAQQYFLHYQAAMAAANIASAPEQPPVPVPAVVPVAAPVANQNHVPNMQNAVQDGALVVRGGEQNLRMNAQGGPMMEEEDGEGRDWLDWFYSGTRFAVLLAIIYFNSNLTRFLLVMSTLLIMYLHTVGWFPFRRPGPQRPDPLQQNLIRAPEENQMQGTEPPPPPAAEDEPMRAVLVPPHQTSAMWTAWVFFKTFFSSLIPEAPQGLVN